ncbi:hypothetical protein PF005_g16353 [Phytophthora fragariae]|uniref:Uncharacterized protein n=1 Tax=Phytophthora fragariae TaxID=53985 RepID=A0A6A3RGW2_9STRA|nr:hypothetical protein PF009_g17773 [Phytophthora fragariae]KAE8997035.1 hypothetical protein PF011_g15660 [Phytophthora fragariae]KAE9096595.1 hypothetical protein PF010_g16284 [Phytophthora fragariae]KAE9096839.1 hypothetical protein PF007_g16843 [Phytophthora fragariae]KAE9130686.1 hypothetical protein PF006_g15709 [Phytophthora fragariae]
MATRAAASGSVRCRAAAAAAAAVSATTAAARIPIRASLLCGRPGERPARASPTLLRSRSCSRLQTSARLSGCTPFQLSDIIPAASEPDSDQQTRIFLAAVLTLRSARSS